MTWSLVDDLLDRLNRFSDRLAIISVANVRNLTTRQEHSHETEFLAEEELDQILGALRRRDFYVAPFLSEDDFIRAVLDGDIDRIKRPHKIVYNTAQFGAGPGRKALVPAFCQLHGIPTTSSDPYVVSLARQKYHFTLVLQSLGFPVPRSWSFNYSDGWLLGNKPGRGTRLIAKPTYESASIGIDSSSVLTMSDEAEVAIGSVSKRLSQPITVQEFIAGFEVEVPIIGLPDPFAPMTVGISVGDVRFLDDKFLTYDLVYDDNYGFYAFNQFGAEHSQTMRKTAIDVFKALGVRGLGRVDFRITTEGNFYITDVATNPHVIKHGSFAFMYAAEDRPYEDLLATLISLGCDKAGLI